MRKLVSPAARETIGELGRKYIDAASLDGEDQWTCTPGSVAEVPEQDSLFDRKTDPFQLNNLIHEHPQEARELYQKLRDYLAELRVT